jgi:hypothetical protein
MKPTLVALVALLVAAPFARAAERQGSRAVVYYRSGRAADPSDEAQVLDTSALVALERLLAPQSDADLPWDEELVVRLSSGPRL